MPDTFRHFLSTLEEHHELSTIDEEVDWKYQLGEKTREIVQTGSCAPALLFENIKGYPTHRVVTNGLGSNARIAIALAEDREYPY